LAVNLKILKMAIVQASILAEMLRQSLQQGQTTRLTVSSNSMAPLLRQGDHIILEATTAERLVKGDIITLATASEMMTHRFCGEETITGQRYLLTRGDRPLLWDAPWPVEALIGRVNGRLRYHRYLRLSSGAGLWLNRQLYRLNRLEDKWWGEAAGRIRPIWYVWSRRGLRSFIYGWAWLMVTFVSAAFGKQTHNSGGEIG
jgi:signal peptidase I